MNTRKKVIKTVYVDEDDSEAEKGAGDFSDSGSEAQISEDHYSSEDEPVSDASAEEFEQESKKTLAISKPKTKRKTKFAKDFISKIQKQTSIEAEVDVAPVLFSVKDLTAADKLLPSVLNLSESDSSDDESPKSRSKTQNLLSPVAGRNNDSDSEEETKNVYKDVWSSNIKDSEEVAKRTFMELEQHKTMIEETKASILNYSAKPVNQGEFEVKDLLAQGEEVIPGPSPAKKGKKAKKLKDDSDSEMEDWEEVKDAKPIPQQGLQLIVDFPDAACRKTKKLDVEMMMKRKINRVKKEYQVYMHKVHVLCWIGHGNYVSKVLNDQDILSAALSLVPSKDCYPGERVDLKYVEHITTWFKDKLTLKQDKNEDKFRPKAPPLKEILLAQVKSKVVTSKKYLVLIFVSMLRALGLQCRVVFNFVTLPIKPPSSELCSLSTKPKDGKASEQVKDTNETKKRIKKSKTSKDDSKEKISQVDGADDEPSDVDDFPNILQLDGNDDKLTVNSRPTRNARSRKVATETNVDTPLSTNSRKTIPKAVESDSASPAKRARRSPTPKPDTASLPKRTMKSPTPKPDTESLPKTSRKSLSPKPLDTEPESARRRNTKKEKPVNADPMIENKLENPTNLPARRQRVTRKNAEIEAINKKSASKNSNATSSKNVPNSEENDEKHKPQRLSLRDREPTNTKESKKINKAKETLPDKDVDSKRVSKKPSNQTSVDPPKIVVTDESNKSIESKYFDSTRSNRLSLSRKRSRTSTPAVAQDKKDVNKQETKTKSRAKSEPGTEVKRSKYFDCEAESSTSAKRPRMSRKSKREEPEEDTQRVSHRDLQAKSKAKGKPKNDVTGDLIHIIKKSVRQAREESKKGIVKGKIKYESDEDSDFLPVPSPKRRDSVSDEDFKPKKISPKPSTSGRKVDRRVLSSDDDAPKNKCDVWCEVFVEELEQWIPVDVIGAKVHCAGDIYKRATHPVCYAVGWDNNNYLKDLTRRYVPHWNTVTRKQRAEPAWWDRAVQPWLGPRSARDKEEDEQLNRMQLEAPLPTSIGEYKNHPLYALKRHLLKFEAIYPPDAATLGFVRNEPVYARECVYVCRSRDTWLKEAKVVRLGETPYKVVKARPKWDRLSNKLITDKPLEVFGPWQVDDYEPPVAENGLVPRNAYGNVELFKLCMLPKGTVHVKLPGLNRVAKKLNIDCAPAMTGFDFNGGWSHPVYDGFVVCKEFEEIITEAWLEDQEEQERKEREKIDARVYGNWRRLIKGLLIRERVNSKYGFENPAPAQDKKRKAPRLVVKKK